MKSSSRGFMSLNKKRVRAFTDGIVDIYTVRDDDTIELVQSGIRFEALTVGSQRFFAAKEQQHIIDKMIAVPKCPEPEANMVAVINGAQYNVLQVQEIKDSFPRTWQMSLESIKGQNEHAVYKTPTTQGGGGK